MYFKIFLERLQRIIFIKYLAVPEPGTESEHPVNSGPLEPYLRFSAPIHTDVRPQSRLSSSQSLEL